MLRLMLLMLRSGTSVLGYRMVWEPLLLFNEVNDTGRSNVSAETPHLVKAARLSLCETAVLCFFMIG